MAYKIRRMLIVNFKPINRAILDFSKKNLIVLDGPNGFGKTTIFDAIELVIRGQVSRVTNTVDGRLGYNDLLFSKDNNKDTIIKIEFWNGEQSFTIVKRFDASSHLKPSDRKPDNWNLFETHLLENFEDPLSKNTIVKAEQIYSRLEIDDLSRYFSLFYYVQQEENTYFLKKSSKDRMNEISQLFDTQKEQMEKEKLERLRNELDKEKRKIEGLLKTKELMVDTLTLGLQGIDQSKLVQIEYFQLLKELPDAKEWDKQDISVQKETRDLYLKELRQLIDFVNNFDQFLKAIENKVLQKYSDNQQLLHDTIISANFFTQFDRLKELRDNEKNLRSLRKCLTKDKVSKKPTDLPIKNIEKWVDRTLDIKSIEEKIQILQEYKNNASSLSTIVQELNTTRESLLQHFEKLNKHNHKDRESCPLCGHQWKSHEQLVNNLQERAQTFRKYYDESAERFDNELNSLFKDHMEPIIKWIDDYLRDNKNIVDEKFFEQLTQSYKRKQIVQSFLDWCVKYDLDLSAFFNQEQKDIQDLESRGEELAAFLRGKKSPIKDGYTEYDEKTSEFESLYQELFGGSQEQVRSITLDQIERKIQYIDFQYFHRSSETGKQLEREISQLKLRFKQVDFGIEKIKEILKIYEQRIGEHWKRIMRDIEIPFYIYSGKILQDYQRGLGLFIQESEGDGVKSIKFVSDSNSDHDAINYLSSGQLSALVIAFTLALNKVYGNKSMNVLLIDDPVQTMDEINMASFVELLRNEFKNKQIILSTHEDEISRYIRYKFKKYGLDTLRINVKERLYLNA